MPKLKNLVKSAIGQDKISSQRNSGSSIRYEAVKKRDDIVSRANTARTLISQEISNELEQFDKIIQRVRNTCETIHVKVHSEGTGLLHLANDAEEQATSLLSQIQTTDKPAFDQAYQTLETTINSLTTKANQAKADREAAAAKAASASSAITEATSAIAAITQRVNTVVDDWKPLTYVEGQSEANMPAPAVAQLVINTTPITQLVTQKDELSNILDQMQTLARNAESGWENRVLKSKSSFDTSLKTLKTTLDTHERGIQIKSQAVQSAIAAANEEARVTALFTDLNIGQDTGGARTNQELTPSFQQARQDAAQQTVANGQALTEEANTTARNTLAM